MLNLLVARDKVSDELGQARIVEPAALELLTSLDQNLNRHASLISNHVSKNAFPNWRDTVQPSEKKWWWRIDERVGANWLDLRYISALLMWIIIAISLSYIVEIARRFLSGGVDILSTVLQGLLALLVGGTLVQLAWQFVESVRSQEQSKRVGRWKWAQITFALLLVSIALTIRQNLPRLASYYSNKCTESLLDGDTTNAIKNCQRAVSLSPGDANAHWVLGKAYEAIYDFDKAQTEFRAAIIYNDKSCKAYNDLAYLYIAQRKDYVGALHLLNTGLEKCERPEVKNPTFMEDEKPRIEYALYKNRGWAYLGLAQYWLAEQNIKRALSSRDYGAEAYCLLAQVAEQRKEVEAAREHWSACVDFARTPEDEKGNKDDVEPGLLSIARERSQLSGLE
ncbi:MAG TPA: hypothetical protein VE732_08795 [Nitrososphaera sp.]|nr:hypothetical protein [Nitrososphaera sp.]